MRRGLRLRSLLLLLTVAGTAALCAAARAETGPPEPIVVSVTLNSDGKGTFLVYLGEGGDILVRRSDLVKMGFREPLCQATRVIDEEVYCSLRGLRSVAFRLNVAAVSLKIAAPARFLVPQIVDFSSRDGREAERPPGGGAFLNYSLEYRADDEQRRAWSAVGEVGGRRGDLLLLSDGFYRESEDERQFVRLMSRVIRDDRARMQRLVLGDFTAAADELGGSLIAGGLSFAKEPRLNPYFVSNPAFSFSGVSALPAEIEISVDGVPVRREKILPGEFEVRNFWQRYRGHRRVDVTIRDVFGGVTQLGRGFFFSDALLRRGYQEYGYHLGFLREGYGRESNEYGPLAFSAAHRYGLTDALTVGFAAEGQDGLLNGGPTLAFPLGALGEVRLASRFSREDGRRGGAGLLAYVYHGDGYDGFLRARRRSAGYSALGMEAPGGEGDAVYDLGASRDLGRLGSLALAYAVERDEEGQDRRTASGTYTCDLGRALALSLTLRNTRKERSVNEAFLGLTWRGGGNSLSARHELRDGSDTTTLSAHRALPEGEGFGYQATARNREDQESLSLDLRYNGPSGAYRAAFNGYDGDGGTSANAVVFASGSVASAGGAVRLGRPVRDAYGLVDVGGIPGVRVYRNNQAVGRTDRDGTLFIPRLDSFYDNEIRIDDRDIPLDFTLPTLTRNLYPDYRQGAHVAFAVRRFQAVSGYLQIETAGGLRPVEYREGSLALDGRTVTFPTGGGGEFYLENLPPGRYEATLPWNGNGGRCVIVVPASEEVILELGKITCTAR